ncbi:TolC family protein [Segetibacter koreensis]|uniref:TolC family protein n=1 Tax=Segetibacter koreensis TaxID=398037 RepID=UPI0003781E56|nr:TolC family protein [Segetibacter koreensis]
MLLLSIEGFGQEKWSLQQCVDYAMKNNVSVKQSDVQARLSAINAKQSKATLFPSITGSVNSSYQHGLTTNPTTNILESSSYLSGSMNLQASYTIFNWNARKNTIAANNLTLKADEIGIDKAKNDIALTVANAFLQVMLRREQARISEVQMNQSKSQLSNTQKLVNAGSQPELNAIQLEAQLAKDSSAVLQANALIEQALTNLKAYINYDFSLPFDIVTPSVDDIPIENITDLQPEAVYQLALQSQPLQKMYKVRIEAAQKQVKASRGYMYPGLAAFGGMSTRVINAQRPVYGVFPDQPDGSYVKVNGTQYPVYSPSFGVVSYSGTPFLKQLNQNFGQDIGIGINFSIFNNYTSRSQWERAKANVNQLQLQEEQENLNLRTNIYNAYQDAFSSYQKYQASQRTVAYSQKALEISKKRFDIGLLGTLDYIITQNNLYLAQIDEVSNHYDFVFKMKVLEFYKGQGIKL